jgi:hypothetical protein
MAWTARTLPELFPLFIEQLVSMSTCGTVSACVSAELLAREYDWNISTACFVIGVSVCLPMIALAQCTGSKHQGPKETCSDFLQEHMVSRDSNAHWSQSQVVAHM